MDLKGLGQVQIMNEFTSQSDASLSLLYYPLIGKDAYILYGILKSFDGMRIDQDKLISLTHISEALFEKARTVLEEFGLLKTYFDEKQRIWLYALYAPMRPLEFLSHETFGRLYINETSSLNYDFMKLHFTNNKEIGSSFMNISKDLDVERLSNWSSQKEFSFNKAKPVNEYLNDLSFDFEEFFKNMDRIFPQRLRTKENLTLIARLANVHGLSATQMKRFVNRSIINGKLNEDSLKKQVMYMKPKKVSPKDPYMLAPVQFMASKQNGAPVSIADQNLIQHICTNYPFSNEVVNVLIEYVLAKTNQQFNKAYVEKVAASWARKGIDTREKALKEFDQPRKYTKKSKDLPDWYQDTQTQQVDEQTLQKALEIQRNLKGDRE